MIASPAILPNEKELFVLISKGDQAAFTKVFDHYEPRIFPFVLKITRSEMFAEEIVQELFIKLWTNRSAVADIENPRSYIFRMATNRTYNYLKSQARRLVAEERGTDLALLEENSTEELIDFKQTEETINKAVESLPEQQKKVYILSRRLGMSAEEIAEQMNLSPKTVKNHLTEALRSLKQQLQNSPGAAIALIVFLVRNAR
jgi:RNA polymerase sigma-70 factor (family 1)